jgi:hypothetical protein
MEGRAEQQQQQEEDITSGGGHSNSHARWIDARSLEGAVRQLEGAAAEGHEIRHLLLDVEDFREDDETRDEDRSLLVRPHPDWFGRFVALLGRPDVSMRSIQFVGFAFDDPSGGAASGVRASDLERLLGSVMPAHPTLKQIRFVRCTMSDAHWGLFVRSLPTTATTTMTAPHKHLSVAGCLLDLALVRPLAEMVRRNVLLSGLALSNSGERMDPYVCQLLCSGMSRNAHLQDLSIDVTDVLPGTMDGATGPASPVRSLYIRGRISPNAVAHLVN